MNGNLICYGLYGEEEPVALMTFQIVSDIVPKDRSLLIYSIYAYRTISLQEWNYILRGGKNIAKELNCKKIIAYSNIERIINLVKLLGGNTETHLLQMEV